MTIKSHQWFGSVVGSRSWVRRNLAKPHCLLKPCADHFAYFRRIATEYPNATRSSTVRPRPRKHSGKRETKLSPLSSVFKFRGIEERTGQIIFVKTTLSLSFSFMKMLSLPTAMPPDAYWNFWECRLRMISKSHRQQYKSKLSNCQRNGRRPISSSKKK